MVTAAFAHWTSEPTTTLSSTARKPLLPCPRSLAIPLSDTLWDRLGMDSLSLSSARPNVLCIIAAAREVVTQRDPYLDDNEETEKAYSA